MKKTFKKSLAVMMVVVMTLTAAPLSGFVGMQLPEFSGVKNIAKSVSDFFSGLSVKAEAAETYSGTCGDNLTWSLDTETGVLEISGTGAMTNYSWASAVPWYSGKSRIKSVTICDEVTSIGNYAFCNCYNLTSITIPDSITNIGEENVFCGCYNLTNITVDKDNANYSSDEYGALFNKDKTTLVQYPIGNTRTNYTIPNSVTTIGERAFDSCDSLKSVTIGNGVTTIGKLAFYSCNGLSSVIIGNGVTSIGDQAFSFCDSLTSITIGCGVTTISDSAFHYCDSLTNITVDKDNANYSNDEYGVLFNKDKSVLIRYPEGDIRTSYTIPSCVTTIGDEAFYDCDNLKSVTIGNDVTTIGKYAFYSCEDLASVIIGDGVTSIGDSAFSYCSDLTSVTIPNSITNIGNRAFDSCYNLTQAFYSGTVEQWDTITVGSYNSYLTAVVIFGSDTDRPYYKPGTCGETLNWILYTDGELVISGTGALTDASWSNCWSAIKNVIIPKGVTSIVDGAFRYGDILTISVDKDNENYSNDEYGVLFNKDKTTLIQYPSANERTSYTVPTSVTTIGYSAFYACNLTSVTIPNSIMTIGNQAFNDCYNLTQAFYSGTVEQWDTITVGSYNSYLTDVVVFGSDTDRPYYKPGACGENLKWILYTDGELVISGMGDMADYTSSSKAPWYSISSSIKNITISDGITSIGNYAFYNCDNLTSTTLPDSIVSIGNYAFYNCKKLAEAFYNGTIEQWNAVTIGSNNSLIEKVIILSSDTDRPYYKPGACGENLTWILYIDGELMISGTGIMTDYSSLSVPWYSKKSSIKSVMIDSGVTTIGANAFSGCTGITEITIPKSVTSVGKRAFADCTSLEKVYFNAENCTSFGADDSNVFAGCSSLKEVIFGEGVTSVPSYAFDACTTLTKVTFADSIKVIGEKAFYNCDGLTSVEIPLSLKTIVNMAFYGCDGLTEINYNAIECDVFGSNIFGASGKPAIAVNFGDQVKVVPAGIFRSYDQIETVNLSKSIEKIDKAAFYYCQGLKNINFAEESNLKVIAESAFAHCNALETVTLPDSVERVEAGAFYNCWNLSNVGLGNVQFLGHCSFGDCQNLKEVVIPNTLTKAETARHTLSGTIIPNDAGEFEDYDCSPFYNSCYPTTDCLQSVEFEDGLEVIPSYVCAYTNIKTATIPASVKTVDEHAFSKCYLDDIYYSSTQANWNKIEIRTDNGNLSSATVHCEGTTHVHNHVANITKKASCFEDGVITYTCSCGSSYTEAIPATGHTPSDRYEIIKTPTCTQTGTAVNKCVTCKEVLDTQEIPATGHTPNSKYETTKAATCTQSGTAVNKCVTCKEVLDTQEIPATGHTSNDKYETTKAATCTQSGTAVNKCVTCKEVLDTKEIPATGHNAGSWVITQEPTCTTEGTKVKKCTKCGTEVETQTIATTEHIAGNWQIITMPTATDEGVKIQKCTGCGKEMSRETIPMVEMDVKIIQPSKSIVNFGDTLVLTLGETELPEDMTVAWFVEGAGVSTTVSEDGLECRVTSIANGNATIYAKLVDADENVVTNADGEEIFDEITVTSKAGFWQKFVSFFKNLFGINRVIY